MERPTRGVSPSFRPDDVAVWIPKGTKAPGTPTEHREFTINCSDFGAEDWGYLFGLDIYQDRMGQLLNDAYIKVTQEGWSDSQRRYQPNAQYSINDLIGCIKSDRELLETYHEETRRAVLQPTWAWFRSKLRRPEIIHPWGSLQK
jgi:hypothetical protein